MAAQHPSLEVRVDENQLRWLTAELQGIRNGVPRAIVNAINQTVPQGRTIVIRGLADVLTVKQKNIRARTWVNKATTQNMVGTIGVMGRRIGLINFKVKDTGKGKGRHRRGQGVIAQAYKTGAPERFPKAFIAIGKSGNKHVFERQIKGGKRVGRLPIMSRKGLSLLTVYKQLPNLQVSALSKIRAVFAEKLMSATDFLLKRKKSDRPTYSQAA